MAQTKIRQKDIAERFGLSRSFISELFSGKKRLGEETCKQLAPKLKTKWWILRDAGPDKLKLIFKSSRG